MQTCQNNSMIENCSCGEKPQTAAVSYMQNITGFATAGLMDIAGTPAVQIIKKIAAPTQLSWTVSRKCNFKCPHCFNNSGTAAKDYEPPRDVMIDNIIDAQPFNVCLCGGEPFAWPDLGFICKKLRFGGIPAVSAVTNAYLATYDKLARAADDGLNNLQISFDGHSPQLHAYYRPSPQSWEKAKQAVIDALKIKSFESVNVSMLPNRYNIDSFPQYVSMMIELGVRNVRVQPLMPIGRGADSYQQLRPTALQYIKLQQMILALNKEFAKTNDNFAVIEWGDPLEHIWFYQRTDAVPHHASIQFDGWMDLTPYLPVMVADLTKHSIRECWAKDQKEMWNIPIMKEMGDTLQILDGMAQVKPRIYFEEPIRIDCFDEQNWELAKTTSDPTVLIEYARKKGLYKMGGN